MARDMTKGNPLKLIFFFAIPVLLGNLFQQFYSIVDTLIVGRILGEDSLAAVGSSGAIVFLVLGFAFGITQGFGVIIARVYGAKKFEELKKSVANSFILTILASIILTLVFVDQSTNLLKLMNTPANIIDEADIYIKTIYYGIIATMFYNATASILRGIGDSKTPLYFLIFSSFLNIALDLLFIIQFKLGVQGAALATVLSQGISAIIAISYMFKKYEFLRPELKYFKVDIQVCAKLLEVGISMAINYSVIAIGVMFLQSGVNQFGSSAVAAFTAATKLENLATQAMPALGAGIATFSAQNLGAKQYDRIFEGVKTSVFMGIIVSLFSIAIYVLFTKSIVRLFIPDITSESMVYATKYLYTCSYFTIFLQFVFIFRNVLQSIGNQIIPVISGVLELLARFIVIYYFLDSIGYMAVALAEPIAWVFAALINIVFYYSWQKNIQNTILNQKL